MSRKIIDLSGKRYGRLIAISYFRDTEKEVTKWKCICDCGNIVFTHQSSLQSGCAKSCGCLRQIKDRLEVPSRCEEDADYGDYLRDQRRDE